MIMIRYKSFTELFTTQYWNCNNYYNTVHYEAVVSKLAKQLSRLMLLTHNNDLGQISLAQPQGVRGVTLRDVPHSREESPYIHSKKAYVGRSCIRIGDWAFIV